MPSYITRRVIQEETGAHLMTVHTWAKSHTFPKPDAPNPGVLKGRTLLYPAEPVFAWLEENRKATPSQIAAMREKVAGGEA